MLPCTRSGSETIPFITGLTTINVWIKVKLMRKVLHQNYNFFKCPIYKTSSIISIKYYLNLFQTFLSFSFYLKHSPWGRQNILAGF